MDNYETFFNIITIPKGKEDETIDIWTQISNFMEKSEGCISTKLHRNRRDPNLLINYAKFRNMDDFMALTTAEEFKSLSQQLTDLGVERVAGVYDVLHSFDEA